MSKPPSTKQLGYLKGLGYRLTPPESSSEASLLIDWLKEGRTPKEAETQLKKHRRAEERKEAAYLRRAIADERRELRELRKDNRDFDLKIIGFVFGSFSPDEHEESEAIYEGTFLPLEVAEQHPELRVYPETRLGIKPSFGDTLCFLEQRSALWPANLGKLTRAI